MQVYEVKKSKFYTYVYDFNNKAKLQSLLNPLKINHKKATHFCYAYWIKNNNCESGGYSDGREPKGTAGKAIFQLLKKCNKSNIIVIVIRYYGGTKLGAANLMRAYLSAAKQGLENGS